MTTVEGEEARQPAPASGVDDGTAARDMRHIVESGSALLWVGSPDGTRRWLGHALARFTGRPPHELAGAGWLTAVHPEDAQRCAEIDLLCLAADRPYTLDYRLRFHDGRYRWIMDSANPCHDPAGLFNGHVGMCVDIEERHRVEEELAERMRRLRLRAQ